MKHPRVAPHLLIRCNHGSITLNYAEYVMMLQAATAAASCSAITTCREGKGFLVWEARKGDKALPHEEAAGTVANRMGAR